MKVLWLTATILPAMAQAIGQEKSCFGGWLSSSLNQLALDKDFTIVVASPYGGKEFISKEINGVRYYLIPLRGHSIAESRKRVAIYLSTINQEFKPEVIHIHGSETPLGLTWVETCGKKGVVCSLQGIMRGIAPHYALNLPRHIPTFRDLVRRDTLRQQAKKFFRAGVLEEQLFSRIHHIIGRTDWDRDQIWAVNPNCHYHYCGETLRDPFYHHKWEYNNCEPHTIFLSSASYSIKGMHMMIKALPLILHHYPDTKVRVAGSNFTNKPWYRITTYSVILNKMIKERKLEDVITFTGELDENKMCQEYLKCNVFVLPSSIENSPNSLGEAQMLGTPHVASFVGGVPDVVDYNPNVLYRYNEPGMLAHKVSDIFAQAENYVAPSFNAKRYDARHNVELLKEIYNKVKE